MIFRYLCAAWVLTTKQKITFILCLHVGNIWASKLTVHTWLLHLHLLYRLWHQQLWCWLGFGLLTCAGGVIITATSGKLIGVLEVSGTVVGVVALWSSVLVVCLSLVSPSFVPTTCESPEDTGKNALAPFCMYSLTWFSRNLKYGSSTW